MHEFIYISPLSTHAIYTCKIGKTIKPPIFYPPMRFAVDRTSVQLTFNDHLPPFTSLLSYHDNINDMQIDFVKRLTEYDVTKGFLVWNCNLIKFNNLM
jgi:hypothetical protein